MRALAGVGIVPVLRVEDPALREPAIAPVPRGQHAATVVATAHHHARAHAVEICDTGEETIHAIAHAVVAAVATVAAPAAQVATLGNVIRRGQRRAGAPVEDGEILRAFEHAPEGPRVAIRVAPVGLHVADHFATAVNRSIRRLTGNLGDAVAVEVIDHELRVVRALADVFAEVDRPQQRAVELVALDNCFARESRGSRVAWTLLGLQNNFVFAIAIEITNRSVVGRVSRRQFKRDGEIRPRWSVRGELERRACVLLLPVQHRTDEVTVRLLQLRALILKARRVLDRLLVQLHRRALAALAIHVEGDSLRFVAQQPPRHEHLSPALIQRHQAPPEVFHLPLGAAFRCPQNCGG